MLSAATRMMVELSLRSRTASETYALFSSTISEPITREQIRSIQRNMKVQVLRASGDYDDAPPPPSDARLGSEMLLKRQLETGQYSGQQRAIWLARHGEAA